MLNGAARSTTPDETTQAFDGAWRARVPTVKSNQVAGAHDRKTAGPGQEERVSPSAAVPSCVDLTSLFRVRAESFSVSGCARADVGLRSGMAFVGALAWHEVM